MRWVTTCRGRSGRGVDEVLVGLELLLPGEVIYCMYVECFLFFMGKLPWRGTRHTAALGFWPGFLGYSECFEIGIRGSGLDCGNRWSCPLGFVEEM